jgi:hypothetical protein
MIPLGHTAMPIDTALCSTPVAASFMLPRTRGDHYAQGDHLCLRPLAMPAHGAYFNVKYLLQHTSKIDETFITYSRNMCMGTAAYAASR